MARTCCCPSRAQLSYPDSGGFPPTCKDARKAPLVGFGRLTRLSPEFVSAATDENVVKQLISFSKELEGWSNVKPLLKPLPSLECVHVSQLQQCIIIRGSPVTELHLDPSYGMLWSGQNPDPSATLISAIDTSSTRITRFTVGRDSKFGRSLSALIPQLYTRVITHLAHLRFLSLLDAVTEGNALVRLAAISTLQELEVFEWRGDVSPRVREMFFASCSKPCRALRHVRLESWPLSAGAAGVTHQLPCRQSMSTRRVSVFSRIGVDSPWDEVIRSAPLQNGEGSCSDRIPYITPSLIILN